mmetsp:Transcript_19699/g.23435  ORF Transcript_19699/g.23435 Transcript_19699/m.23435 type:complete len:126 (-) Transcript_19699:293-670(-)
MSDSEKKEVIHWEDALEQCGDDEDFLRELLGDLKDEVLENYSNIKDAIGSRRPDWADKVRQFGHAVKGAAANLMCHELNHAAVLLEARAKAVQNGGNDLDLSEVTGLAEFLHEALVNFVNYVDAM